MIYKGKELEEYKGITNNRLKNLTGHSFGKWKVLCRAPNNNLNTRFWCECTCGTLRMIASYDLINKLSTQCRKCSVQKENKIKKFEEIPLVVWKAIRNKSVLKNKEFSITLKYVWDLFLKQDKRCALSGQPIGFNSIRRYNKRGWKISNWVHTASLDRIDSSKGYVELNWMKNFYNQDYFIYVCHLVSEYNKKRIESEDKFKLWQEETAKKRNSPRVNDL